MSPDIASAVRLRLAAIRAEVDDTLATFLDGGPGRTRIPYIEEFRDVIRTFLAGGKRLRPMLCVAGWYAAGGAGDRSQVVQVAASLELFHTFTLIHDDVMDASAVRRGRPTVHRLIASRYAARADADRFGVNVAILLGDVALAWSDELLHTAGLDGGRLSAVLGILHDMRTEVMAGQFMDLLGTGRPSGSVEDALRVARYKTAKYTVERPLHIGAVLAGGGRETLAALSAFALPLGEAFQLRDDLTGVFGRPGATGKSNIDDLRDAKPTVLVALALRRATVRQSAVLHAKLGRPTLDEAGAEQVRRVLRSTGAHARVERMAHERYQAALRVVDQPVFPRVASATLRELAHMTVAEVG